MADIKLDGLTVASSSGSPTVVNLDSDVASRITAKGVAKAWVNFDGTNAFSPNPSTTAIRSSFNVSSITEHGAGDYTITYTTAMVDENYCISGSTGFLASTSSAYLVPNRIGTNGNEAAPSASAVRINSVSNAGSATDTKYISVAIFGS